MIRASKRAASVLFLIFVVLLLTTGCALPGKASKSTKAGSKPSAQQLILGAQQNFATVKSFHIVMQVQNPGPVQPDQIQIRTASGDVAMPDKVKGQATVMLSGQAVSVNLVSVGEQQFITDPVTGQWRVIKGVLDPRTLTNPETGIISVFGKLKNVSQPAPDNVNGVQCWRVTGQLDAQDIAFVTGGGVPRGTTLQTSVCVGRADALPYQVIVTGIAAPGDTPQTSRIFLMSNYNKAVQITVPTLGS